MEHHRTWAVYTRVSDDRTSWLGIAHQLLAADAHLLRSGVPQARIRHYTENGTSAWKRSRTTAGGDGPPRVLRRQWSRLQLDASGGRVDAVLVPHLDRLARDERDLEDAIALVDGAGVIVRATSGDLDLDTSEGRQRARLLVWHAEESSRDMSRRATESHRRSAVSGRHVGGPRPFGWLDDRVRLHPVESVHLKRWIEGVLRGATWRSVVADSRERGVTGTRGAAMNPASVRQLVLNPRNCGLRMFGGRLLTDERGDLVRGEWQTVCTLEEHLALVSLRGEHPRLRAGSGGQGAHHHYLLNGIARCARCGSALVLIPRSWTSRDGSTTVLDSYACPAPGSGGCSGVARNASRVDAFVVGEVQRLAGEGSVAAAWSSREAIAALAQRELDALEEERAQRLRDLALGDLGPENTSIELDALDRRCNQLFDELRASAEHRRRTSDPHALCFTGPAWQSADLAARRQRLRDAVHAVLVRPSTTVGTTFDESAVEVRLRPPG